MSEFHAFNRLGELIASVSLPDDDYDHRDSADHKFAAMLEADIAEHGEALAVYGHVLSGSTLVEKRPPPGRCAPWLGWGGFGTGFGTTGKGPITWSVVLELPEGDPQLDEDLTYRTRLHSKCRGHKHRTRAEAESCPSMQIFGPDGEKPIVMLRCGRTIINQQ